MKAIAIIIAALLILPINSDAQFDKLKEKFGIKKKDKKEKTEAKERKETVDLSQFMGGGDVELEESYTYDFAVTYLITSSDSEEPMEMTQLFSRDHNYFGMMAKTSEKGKDARDFVSVFDIDRSYMIMLNQDDAQAIVMEYKNMESQIEDQIEMDNAKDFTITKTGKTKTIAGYLCYQYLYTSQDGNGEIWTTKEIDYKSFDMYSHFQKMNRKGNDKTNSAWGSGVEGYMLLVKGVNEEGDTFEMLATKVDEHSNIKYEMKDYEVMDLSKMGGYGGYPKE